MLGTRVPDPVYGGTRVLTHLVADSVNSLRNVLIELRGDLAFGVGSQFISSGTTFALSVYLVRSIEKSEFGLYGLAFAITMFFSGLLAATMSTQFTVNRPDIPQQDRKTFALEYVAAFSTFVAALAAICIPAAIVVASVVGSTQAVGRIAFAIVVATVGFGVRDLAARIAYSEGASSLVFGAALVAAVVIASILTGAELLQLQITGAMAISAYGLAQLIGGGYAVARLRLPWRRLQLRRMRATFENCWKGGRWSMLASVASNLRTQAHNFVVAPLLGFAALADINATRILVTPAILLIPPLSQVASPKLAELRSQSVSTFFALVRTFAIGLSLFALAYAIVVMSALPVLTPLVLGEKYEDHDHLVLAWCAFTALLASRVATFLALEALRQFVSLTRISWVGAAIGLALSFILAKQLGSAGAVWAVVLGELCLTLHALLYLRNLNRSALERGSPKY